MGRTVGFATFDRPMLDIGSLGGAGWYRCGLPSAALATHGTDARLGCAVSVKGGPIGIVPALDTMLPSEAERMARLWVPDVIVLQRYMHKGMADSIRQARANGQVVVNDVDDLLWNLPVTNQAWRHVHPGVNPDSNIHHYRRSLAASSVVTCSTPYLAEEAARFVHDGDVVVLRNCIDLAEWEAHDHHDPPRLGWTGVLSHRSNDVEILSGGLRTWLGQGWWDRFVHVGAAEGWRFHEKAGLNETQVVELPMVRAVEWSKALDAIDVGVVPLSDHRFNRAKSAIKGIEYAAAGIPFVASDAPEYRWLHTEHGIGRLASRGKHWGWQLRELLDPEVRTTEAKRQREAVAAFDIATRWTDWSDIYENAAA